MKKLLISSVILFAYFLIPGLTHAQWQQTNGPYGGSIYCFANSGMRLFSGTYGGGVFLSTNNGTSWTAVNSGLTATTVRALAVSPNKAGDTNLFAGTSGGVFLSTNNGTTWTAANTGLTHTYVYVLAVSPNGAGDTNFFAGTSGGGIFRSTNNGANWTEVNSGLTNMNVYSLAVSPNGPGGANLFAGTIGGGVFLSTNNGTSWNAVNLGLTNMYVYSLAVIGANLFAGTSGGVFLSTNNGTSWTAVNSGLTAKTVNTLAVSGTNVFAGTNGGVFFSTNNGTSWTAVNSGITNPYVFCLAVSGSNLFAGTDGGGVFLSTNNGVGWNAVNSGLTGLWVHTFAVSPNGAGGTNLFVGVHGCGVFLSTNSGTTWNAMNSGLTNLDVYCLTVVGSNLFAGTAGGGVFLSINNGTSWNAVNSGLTNLDVRCLAVSPNGAGGSNLFAGTYGGVFLSTNNGASWTALNSGLTNPFVNCLSISGANLFAGTSGGGIFLSTNNGTSWNAMNSGLTNMYVHSLTVIGANLFAGTWGGGIFLSTNNGASWTALNSGLTNLYVNCLSISGANLFAGTSGGVFLSTNNGTSWTAMNSGLTNKTVYALAVGGTNLFAGIQGGGVWHLPLSTITQERIVNGKFENGADSWALEALGTASGTFDIDGTNPIEGIGSARVTINASDSTDWHLQFQQVFGALSKDKRYYIKFRARASKAVKIDTWIAQNHDSYSILFSKHVSLNTVTQNFVDSVDNYEDDSNVKLTFVLGTLNNGDKVWFDEVSVVESNIPEGTTQVPTIDVAGQEKIINGKFENGINPWELELNSGGNAKYELETSNPLEGKGSAHITITNSTGTDWHVQFKQALKVLKGSKYYILYQARASQGATILAGIQQYHSPYSFLSQKIVRLTTKTLTVLDTTTFLDEDDDNVKLTFLLGNIGNVEVWLDNITVIEYSPVIKKPIFSLSKVQLGFGKVKIGATKKDSVNVSNPGTDTLKVSGVSSTNQSFTFAPATMTLVPSVGAYLIITFVPQDTLDKSGFIILTHNAEGSPDSIAVSGKGVLTGVDDKPPIPTEYALSQNYPNPFNPTTTIKFSLPARSDVYLELVSTLGQVVKVIASGNYGPGNYEVTFDASHLSSGMYLYRMVAGTFAETKKLVVVK